MGSVGEPINPEAWLWYQRACQQRLDAAVVDTWWQTETGLLHLIAPLPRSILGLEARQCHQTSPWHRRRVSRR